ncbi:MAG: aminotransferase class I/II-fold pyridoxal phosphate-dependent enzyme [Pseudomonadota bacterium]
MKYADELRLLDDALGTLASGFSELPDFQSSLDVDALRPVLIEAAERMTDNYPYFHPLYAGQMLKPPHPVARIAYALSLWVNPNNHALDGGRASSAMEKECVSHLAEMFGWERHLGHLTSGGTMANLEALWISDRLHPGKRVLASKQSHYTHARITDVLKIPFAAVTCSADGSMDLNALEDELRKGDVGTVVATLGTTGIGAVDPLDDILALKERYGIRVHVDAAYGGYFTLSSLLGDTVRARYDALTGADSIVIDPLKHGLQPYGCGCVLFSDPSVGRFYRHDSAYTYFSSDELHLGEISLECSRAGAAAVALWATQRLMPSVPGGEFSQMLDSCIQTARDFVARIDDSASYLKLFEPMLDIAIYSRRGDSAEAISSANQRVFDNAAEREHLHLALMNLDRESVADPLGIDADGEPVSCLRSVFMKPEQRDITGDMLRRLESVAS